MQPQVRAWFERRTSAAGDWPLDRLLAAKAAAGTSVGVVLPALDEEPTVGGIVASIRAALMDAVALVDELVVVDSGSRDRTAAVAAAAGARVVARDAILPRVPAVPGKGDVLWRSLLATTSDVVVFVDADLREFSPDVVTGLLGPLLCPSARPSGAGPSGAGPSGAVPSGAVPSGAGPPGDGTTGVELVKGVYDRPLRSGETVLPAGGGRVTELVARPVLNLHWPELAGFVQPLAGEYAARRRLLERLPFPCGYGVELALLVDTLGLAGLDSMAQVDLGVRHHRHQDDAALGRMAAEVWQAALARLAPAPAARGRGPAGPSLTQFERSGGGFRTVTHDVTCLERPPMITVPEYAARADRQRSA